jgi:hypothetical protein
MKPGRTSTAALASVTALPVRLLEAPQDLTAEQADVWASVVVTKPADWFDAGSVPILAAYCRAVVESRKVAALVESMTSAMLLLDDGLKRYKDLRRLQAELSGEVNTLARAMRLTQQSKYRADAAAVADGRAKGARPWHRVIDA